MNECKLFFNAVNAKSQSHYFPKAHGARNRQLETLHLCFKVRKDER